MTTKIDKLREELEDAAVRFAMGHQKEGLESFVRISEELAQLHKSGEEKPIDPTVHPLEAA